MASITNNNNNNTTSTSFSEPLKPSDAAIPSRSRNVSAAACPTLFHFNLPSTSNGSNISNPLQVCDDALKLLERNPPSSPSSVQQTPYQRELLLDNLTFLQEALDASRQHGLDLDDFEDDLLSEGDIEDDDDHDWDNDEASLSSHLPMFLFGNDYQLPLVDKSSSNSNNSTLNASSTYSQVSKFQRSLLLDRDMEGLQQAVLPHFYNEDDLSQGDVESDLQGEVVDDLDDDDQEEDIQIVQFEQEDEDDVSVVSDMDYLAAHRSMAPRTFPSSE